MSTISLKRDSKIAKAGGSKIIRIPNTFSEVLGFEVDGDIEMFCDGTVLTIKAKPKAEETLESILAASAPGAFDITSEDREWLDMPRVGAEI